MALNNNSPEMAVKEMLSILSSTSTGDQSKIDLYDKFARQFQEAEVSLFSFDVRQNMSDLARVLMRDIMSANPEVCQGALATMCVCLHDSDIVRALSDDEAREILNILHRCILKTQNKSCCTRALWCLGKQNIPTHVVSKQVSELVQAVEHAAEMWGGQSVTVEHELVNTIDRLAEQAPAEMGETAGRWGKLLATLVCHSAVKVRERVLVVMETTARLIKKKRKDFSTAVLPMVKTKVIPEMKKLFAGKQELFVLKSWSLLVDLFGEELHHGAHINALLQVAELGFKSTQKEVKMASFRAWQQLIDNFAINPAILSDPKRIKLIMQVFKLNNANQEEVALLKMRVWWHFIWLLGSKISANFDLVAVPFIQFCCGTTKQGDQSKGQTPRRVPTINSPGTPHMQLPTPSSQWPVFESLQQHGCEALALFLASPPAAMEHDFKLDILMAEVVTGPSFFIKHASMFITTATELFTSLGKDVSESVILHVWQCLVTHLKNAIDSPVKLDVRETLHTLLLQFQIMVLSRVVNSSLCLKVFEQLSQLPRKLLSSSAYSMPGQEMNSTPALFLISLLLTPVLLHSCGHSATYLDLFTQLLSCDQGVGTLDFVESVAEMIRGGLVGTTGADTDEAGLKLWTALAHSLQEHLNKTNEVNQGDAIDPKFTCCVQMLVLPMKHVSQVSQHTLKSVQKTWMDLYRTVDRLTAMVTNAEANIICEEVSQKILEQLKIKEANVTEVDWLVSSCHTMVSCLDFSSLGNQSMFTLGSPSPKKMVKKRNKALHNLHSFVQVLEALQNEALQLAIDTTKKPGPVGHQGMLNQLVDIFSTLFTHVTPSHLIYNLIGQLARPIGNLFTESSHKSSSKVFNNAFQQKLEKLWQDITTAVQSRYTSLYDSQFLTMMAPLLEGTLVHPRRQIKNATITMWTSTFATTPSLEYPESLKLVLTKVKEKSHIQLPGWVAMETSVVQETPQSQMSQMDQSQMPEARLPGMPSPHKIHGSLLNKAVSPNVKMSPKRTVPSPKATSAKKKVLDFYDNDKDFVVIAPPPKKKMVLTAHQKEVLKERKDLPAMYNSLELSMDVSLMAAHFTTDTQMDSSCHDDTPTPTTQPFSLFGSAISPSDATTKIVSDKKEETEKKKAEKKSSRGKKDASQESKSPSLLDETSQTRRRSVRFMDNATTSSPAETTNSTSKTKTPNKKAGSQTEKSDNLKGRPKSKRGGKDGEKSSNESNNSSRLSSGDDSVVVIGDSEEQDMETQPPDGEKTGTVSDSSVGPLGQKEGVTKGKVGGVDKGEADVDMKVDERAESQVESLPQNVLGLPEVTSLSSSTNSSSKAASSPYLLTMSSDKLSSQKKSTASNDESSTQKSSNTDVSKSSNDNLAKEKAVRSPCKDGKQAAEQASSQPLLSWAQKLDELSQSPKVNISPLRKSFSQDDPKVCSPHKSPSSKTKKKQTKENESKGALDKWIIRSPSKKVDLSNRLNNDAIVASVLSGTVVEETQSPTKFDKIEKGFKSSLSSVMETPPKNVLETLSSSIGNSNRKLFGSQSSNGDEVFNMVEDSNIVPGSPDSKSSSGKTGTPILKIRKLTEEEIRRYSPKKMTVTDSVISILQSSAPPKLKDSSIFSKDESSHEHDDFSDLTPLEKTEFDASSKALSDTDQALLQISNSQLPAMKGGELTGGKKSQLQVKKQDSEQSSQNLFSQESTVGESVDTQHDSFVLNSVETIKETSDSTSSVSQQLFSEIPNVPQSQISESQLSGMGSENAGSEASFDITAAETLNGDIMTPRRNRKRKQVTPKKFSPEDIRSPKRKKISENESAKKSSQKTTNKNKEKNNETDTTPVKKISNSPSVQETEIKSTQNSEGSQSSVDSSGQCTIIEFPEKKSKPVRKVSLTLKKVEAKIPTRGSRKDSKGSENNCDKDRIEEQKKVVEKNDMLDDNKDGDNVIARKGSVEVKTKKNSGKLNDDLEEKTSSGKAVEKLSGKKLSGSDKEESNRESRKTARPVRRSTVKQKKQRDESNEQKDNTNVLVNYGNSNLDVNDSEERMEVDLQDLYKKDANKDGHVDSGSDTKGKTKLNNVVEHTDSAAENSGALSKDTIKDASKTDTLETEKDAAISKKEENVTEYISIISEDSDDDQPLIALTRSQKKDGAKSKGGQSLENKGEVDHRKSDKKVNTRLRVVSKGKTSPQAKKSVNLAIKRSRRSAEKNASENGDDVDQGDKHGKTSYDASESKNENKMSDTIATCNKDDSDIVDLVSLSDDDGHKEKTLDKFKENVLKSLNLAGQEGLEITPKKGYEGFKTRSALLVRNSDSKLFIGQRKFARRQGVARRSILKPASVGGTSENAESPKRMEFHPITISRIYSPTASPSASILKKRRLSGEPQVAETCSPPSKQRRVSFAEPLTETDNPALEAIRAEVQRPMSPLASKAKNGSTPVGSLTATKLFGDSQSQSSLGSPVSNTYQSSANTQLDATEPIFPELCDCTQSVEKILPQLTSSMWSRGLGQLVRARNIHTIGDLAQLTEADIDNLPVRAPKVATVKQVLEKYLQAQKLKTGRSEDKSEDKLEDKSAQQENTAEPDDGLEKGEAMDLDSNKDLGAEKVEQQEIPHHDDKEEAGEAKSTEKMSEDVAKNDDKYSIDVEKMLASSNTLLDEVNRLSQSIDQSGSPDQSCNQATNQSSSSLCKKGGKVSSEGGGQEMIDRLQELAHLCHTEEVRSLRTDQLFQAHQHLADIQAAIVSSLRSRCHSPTS